MRPHAVLTSRSRPTSSAAPSHNRHHVGVTAAAPHVGSAAVASPQPPRAAAARTAATALAAAAAVTLASTWPGAALASCTLDSGAPPAPVEAAAAAERAGGGHAPLAELAALFDGESDPIEPFTLFGTNFKKYVIEVLQGEKIVSRQRGITVDTCVAGYSAAEDSPRFNGTATRDKVFASPLRSCAKAEGQDLRPTCAQSCRSACEAGLDKYVAASDEFTGFAIPAADKARVLKGCARNCTAECMKPGKAFDFVVPYRR